MKIDMKFKITDADMEFAYSETNKKWELCKWFDDKTKYVVAFFDKGSEGYDMRTVGMRFFEHDSWNIAKRGMKFLAVLFEEEA